MMANEIKDWAVLFDLDETLVLTSAIEPLRRKPWARAYAAFHRTRLPNGTLEFVEAISNKTLVGVVTKAPRQYAEKLLSYLRGSPFFGPKFSLLKVDRCLQ
jgi:beta-phosphoglucomutase-like phosphatase (HAD superfamily)